MRKKKGARGIIVPDFKLYLKAMQTEQYSAGTKIDMEINGTGIERTKINPHTYGQLIYNTGDKNIQWRKDSLFNKWCWDNWIVT